MEIIVLSPEGEYPGERKWVGRLFAAGLRRYHLRKPGWEDAEFEAFLENIPRDWRPKVVVHQCHRAVEKYHLGGWHCKDREEQLKTIPPLRQSVPFPATLSRSIHRLDDLRGDLTSWDYVFLSPVYRSITKANYGPRWERTELEGAIRRCKESSSAKVYALGGVEPANIPDCALMGFDGVALLGAIWSSHHPIRRFREALACMSQYAVESHGTPVGESTKPTRELVAPPGTTWRDVQR